MPIEITQTMYDAAQDEVAYMLQSDTIRSDFRRAMQTLLDLPETRGAVLAAVEREHAEMMFDLPEFDEMSDLDKGAVLLFCHKLDSEGDDYAREHYPVKFIDDPRLTALDPDDACDHAARFEDLAQELDGDEHERLYGLALNHKRSN